MNPIETMIRLWMDECPSHWTDAERRAFVVEKKGLEIPALLSAHRTALEAMIEANARAEVNRVTRIILDSLDEQARKYLRLVARHEADPDTGPYGTVGALGENGAAPAIRDLVRQAERHRRMGAVEQSSNRKAA
jgi:hypothetical protein